MTSLYSICLTILSCCLLTVCGCKSFSTTSVNEIQTNEVSTKKLSIVTKLKENAQLPIEERIALYHKLKEEVKGVLEHVKKNSKLKSLLKQVQVDRSADQYMKAHIGMLINISAAICAKMQWNSEKTIEKFVYASYLHDWALAMRPDLARINTFAKLDLLKDTLTEEDYQIVLDHPNIAAKQISDINEIPPDVDMMIKQHHEFGNETGFPSKCGYQKITPFSAVFIVAHTLTDYIIDNPKWTIEDFIKTNKSRLHGSHFTKIMRVLPELK